MKVLQFYKFIFFIFSICFIISCGTVGGFEKRGFAVSKQQLENVIDSLYKNYPDYQLPAKWKHFDDWNERGYDFLEARIFYFKNPPEEMYFVSFVGDATNEKSLCYSEISIRAINQGNPHWLLQDNFNSKEIERMEKRFNDDIVNKMNNYIQ